MKAYINCRIYKSEDTAFLIDGNEIIATGSDETIRNMTASNVEVIDLNQMLVLPGFADTHMHLISLGRHLCSLRLDGTKSSDQLKDRLSRRAAQSEKGEWILGRGYNEELFADGIRPTKQLLDEVCPDNPVMIIRTCGHIAVINSKAMDEAGITEETEVNGGTIHMDSGLLEENAITYVREKMPKPDEKTVSRYIEEGMKYCNAHGITLIGSDDFRTLSEDYRDTLNLFEKLSYQEKLTVRVNEQCQFASPKEFASFLDDGYTFDVGNDFFRIGPLQLIIDGSLGGRSAAMLEDYKDDPGNRGMMVMDEEEIETFVRLANRFNMPAIAHAIGDAAVETMLDIFEDTVYEGNPLHSGLVHCQIMSKEQMERIIRMKLSCYIQPQFIDADAAIVEKRAGKQLAETSYPFRTLFENTLTSGGSDAPVELPDPLAAIRFACTRTSIHTSDTMNQDECMNVEEAIELMCDKGYEQFFMNDRYGKIAKGYMADFTVLDKDIRTMKPEEITDTKVMMTVMDGRTVYER